ncbi:MAG: 2OG-Fe(II) oxygenase [Devosiaceae bacterium]|nr:2OG-Fe(II) oxygenase [Devosiaceae bacterium MH13]
MAKATTKSKPTSSARKPRTRRAPKARKAPLAPVEAAETETATPAEAAEPAAAKAEAPKPQAPAAPAMRTVSFGEAIPLCYSATRTNPRFAFGSLGGRYVLLGFLPAPEHPDFAKMMGPMRRAMDVFDAANRVVALATAMENSRTHPELLAVDGSLLVFHDDARGIHDTFGVTGANRPAAQQNMPHGWFVLDPSMRVMAMFSADVTDKALDMLEALPDPMLHAGVGTPAPVLIIPRVFEPDFCKALLAYYTKQGGEASGVTRERDGKTLVELDNSAKKRFDCLIEDEALRRAAMQRVYWRLAPQIQKAFQFKVTRMERYIVCCYDAETGGYFKAHRDNTTKGTAHRRFAVSINLNAEEFGGGGVMFPEYSKTIYNPPTGGALVFSCSILHEALPITSGQRYAFLPFLYDDAAAEIRRANNAFLDESVGNYTG